MRTKERCKVFLAIPLDSGQLDALQQFRDRNRHLQGPGFRWMPDENLHITAFFLGHILLRDQGPIENAIRACTEGYPAFRLQFERFCLQPKRKPRMIWAQYRYHEAFGTLANRVADAVRPYCLDRAHQHRRPIPHITLARIKPFAAVEEPAGSVSPPDIAVQRVELWLSETGPRNAVYTSLCTFSLAPTAED